MSLYFLVFPLNFSFFPFIFWVYWKSKFFWKKKVESWAHGWDLCLGTGKWEPITNQRLGLPFVLCLSFSIVPFIADIGRIHRQMPRHPQSLTPNRNPNSTSRPLIPDGTVLHLVPDLLLHLVTASRRSRFLLLCIAGSVSRSLLLCLAFSIATHSINSPVTGSTSSHGLCFTASSLSRRFFTLSAFHLLSHRAASHSFTHSGRFGLCFFSLSASHSPQQV